MALVTVQRSPNSVAESPQCSSDGEAEDDEGSKNEKSECFAGKSTALVLALKDMPQYPERRLSTDSNRSNNSTQSNNSDIHQHLQSMFNLLPAEETLKMAVKLESQRPNRTRYLVIASRCCSRNSTADRKIKIVRNNSARIATTTTTNAATINTARQLSMDGSSSRASQQQQLQQQPLLLQMSQTDATGSSSNDISEMPEKRLSSLSTCPQRQRHKSETLEKSASGDNNKCSGSNSVVMSELDLDLGNCIEESCLLGIDCNERTTIGLVVPILADTTIHLDGDGGFSVTVFCKTHIFKPVSVQTMWSALQTLHKVSQKARENNFYPGGPSHEWLSYYENRIESEQSCLNEWNAMDSLESRRPPSPDAIRNKPTAKEETESVIKMKLKEIMMSVDLDEVTSKYIRGRLEEHLDMDLGEYKSFIDEEMLMILGQMDAPTEIFEHVYLGSEWNASNLEELLKNGVRHILNVTREIDNFFPGIFDYFNVRVYDDEKTNLLKHWDNTYRYITRAKAEGSKVLVHCKMGVSRSASVVIAYAMKAYNWEFDQALQHVKERRNCIKPNKNFLAQLETYRGMLDAMLNKEKLQRSKSETNLKSTKDARLLPGSEPTPLIQALNQSKSKSAGHGVESGGDGVDTNAVNVVPSCITISTTGGLGGGGVAGGEQKQRRIVRRSSSTSPKSMHAHASVTVVMKQQSQSLENLTPERSIAADEPKNVRFPGSNGENYSVTQNQVLHIQKNTPPPPPPPPPPPSSMSSSSATSVRHIVYGLETQQDTRKTADDRKTLNLPFGRTISQETTSELASSSVEDATGSSIKGACGSPVWTSSAKLITQTSHMSGSDTCDIPVVAVLRRTRCDTFGSQSSSDAGGDVFSSQVDNVFAREEEKRHNRKTQSWAPATGISVDATMIGSKQDLTDLSGNMAGSASTKLGSNSSIDSAASSLSHYECHPVRTRTRQRELPLRHASWGSGDNRCGLPMRNSSWGSYDTNRNNFLLQYGTTSAIFEGQIHELNMSNKTASQQQTQNITNTHIADDGTQTPHHQHHLGTVKRTKQKLEERTHTQKKLCQENGSGSGNAMRANDDELNSMRASMLSLSATSPQKRGTTLHRSSSAAGTMRTRYPNRCNSEEIMPTSVIGQQQSTHPLILLRRSDGSRPLQTDLISASSAPESSSSSAYTMSDIENKNTDIAHSDDVAAEADAEGDTTANVLLRGGTLGTAASVTSAVDEQRLSGNVQTLKKSFEAKAGTKISTAIGQTNSNQLHANSVRKGHQSLPSSPVAQHVEHQHSEQSVSTTTTTTTNIAISTTTSNANSTTTTTTVINNARCCSQSSSSSSSTSSSASSSASSVSESSDRRSAVKGLVHRYQPTYSCAFTTTTTTNTSSPTTTTTAAPTATVNITSINSSINYRQRPRSYYENPSSMQQRLLAGRSQHDYNDSRPPPAPARTNAGTAASSTSSFTTHRHSHSAGAPINDSILTQQQQQQQQPPQRRPKQEFSRTHPVTKLKMQQTFNATAYNTM